MPALNNADRDESHPASDPYGTELENVKQRLSELREQGIFADGHDPEGRPRTIAHVPGALERFMERRG